jgi:hypothetical protein
MRKFVCALIVTVCAITIAVADETAGRIMKVEGNNVTFVKGKKKGEEGVTYKLTRNAATKVVKGKFDKDTKKVIAGDPLEKGELTKRLEKAGEKGVAAVVVTEGEIKDGATITEIRLIGKKGGKKKKDAN